jgi:hypothetical protein
MISGLAGNGPMVVPIAGSPAMLEDAGGKGAECGAVRQMAMNMLQPVDVIFSVDTSGTMRDEIGFVKENMNAFSKQIRDSGIDVHVVLLATEQSGTADPFGGLLFTDGLCIAAPLGSGMCPRDSNPPNYVHIVEQIGQWNILDAYILRYPDYKMYLREGALKTFVSVSDADASTAAEKFVNDVKALEPSSKMWSQWRYAAIYPFEPCPGVPGQGGDPGPQHADLVTRTDGIGGDLCKQDFAPVFNAIAKKLVDVVQLACEWDVPAAPAGETFERMKTNVQINVDGKTEMLLKAQTVDSCGMRDGWHYDDESAPKRVVACPTTCQRLQAAESAAVDVLFGCATQVGPM